jgi:hypothetical protein
MAGRAAAAHLDVVAVEGDVDGAERGRFAGALLDEPAQALCERDTPGLDADERDPREVGVGLDDLVCDPRERPAKAFVVEEEGSRRRLHRAHDAGGAEGMWAGSFIRLLSGLTGPG